MRRRYLRIGFAKPAAFDRRGRDFVVFDLESGKRIESLIPLAYAEAFWRARVGDRVRGRMLLLRNGGPYQRNAKRGRRELASTPVTFRFAAIGGVA